MTAAAQLEMMRRAHLLQVEEMKRAAEPIFVWGGGSASDKRVRWEFRNEGGSVSHLTVTLPSPTGVPTGIQADIRPKEWLGNSRYGIVTFDGNVGGEIRFTLGFRTRIGGVGGFFFVALRETKPILTGSGWV